MCTARASERGCSCENRNILGTHRATGGILPLLLTLSVETLCYPHSPILFCASAKTIGTMHFALCQSHSLFLTLFCMSPFLIINYAVLELNFVQTMCLYFYFLLQQMYGRKCEGGKGVVCRKCGTNWYQCCENVGKGSVGSPLMNPFTGFIVHFFLCFLKKSFPAVG